MMEVTVTGNVPMPDGKSRRKLWKKNIGINDVKIAKTHKAK